MTNEYYKQDLCNSESSCKLYNPLVTQGQCEYYNQWCELKSELEVYKNALELACERIKNMYEQEQQYCTNEIENFTQVEFNYFTALARKELEEKDE